MPANIRDESRSLCSSMPPADGQAQTCHERSALFEEAHAAIRVHRALAEQVFKFIHAGEDQYTTKSADAMQSVRRAWGAYQQHIRQHRCTDVQESDSRRGQRLVGVSGNKHVVPTPSGWTNSLS